MPWLRPGPPPHVTGLAMIGAKAGQRVLMLGAADAGLAAAVAGVTGLNGCTLVVDPAPGAQEAIERAAAAAGTLVEFEHSPLSPPSSSTGVFDIVVLSQTLGRSDQPPHDQIADARRAIREGGRIVVIERGKTRGIFAAFRGAEKTTLTGETIRDLLTGAGFSAARVLAQVGGFIYMEASKRRG